MSIEYYKTDDIQINPNNDTDEGEINALDQE